MFTFKLFGTRFTDCREKWKLSDREQMLNSKSEHMDRARIPKYLNIINIRRRDN